ncbi:MAG: M1 family metallopeptidase [Myxococcales bacterium]|nr:M1 family metallopeptidase [Myxococcota bacterium]MDW8280890.1 M1 family metallopeptidase [Myxococcales bacterium]
MPALRTLSLTVCLLGACRAIEQAAAPPSGVHPRQALPPETAPPVPPSLRLPAEVRPLGYDVTLTIRPEQEFFDGDMVIDLAVGAPVARLWLNGTELTIQQATLHRDGQQLPARLTPTPATAHGVLGLDLGQPVPAGRARLHLRYRGLLSQRDNDGLFRQQEGDHWYVFSDFEPTDARRAFPCFDEPSAKVPWQLTLRVPQGLVALANTEVESETLDPDGMHRVRFRRTAPLPSYLVALAVGPFDIVEAGRGGQSGTPLRIIVPRGRGGEARLAARVSGELLGLLEDYFGIPYPFGKLDQIAVLRFQGAMENPGLIAYAQDLLLARPEEETVAHQRRFAAVAAHEMAHQWFGNLVTMRFWEDVWLNESFASWMEARTVAQWRPRWDMAGQRIRSRNHAMEADSLTSARSVRQPIESLHDIHNAFDAITYQKGQAILEMFERYIGPERFRQGVRRHLREHAFGHASAEDFLAVLAAESGAEGPAVASAMRTFLDQPGVPLVRAACLAGPPVRLQLSQRRYLPLGALSPPEHPPARWHVPVCVRHAAGRTCTLLTAPEGELVLPGVASCDDLLVPNADGVGYYRVHYGPGMLARLLRQGGAELTPPERVAVLDDIQALMHSGDLPADEAVQLTLTLARDRNRHVVEQAIQLVRSVHHALVPRALRPAYARLVRAAFGPQARRLGLRSRPGEDEEVRLGRRSVVGLVGWVGQDQGLLAEARRLAAAWLDNPTAVSPDDLDLVLHLAGRQADPALFERLHAAALAAPSHAQRMRLVGALAAVVEPQLVQRALHLVLSGSLDIRESVRILLGVAREEDGAEQAYRFVKEHFDTLVARLPRNSGALLVSTAGAFCDEEHHRDVAAFFGQRAAQLPGGPRRLAQVLEQIRLCAALRAAQQDRLVTLLRTQGP